MGRREEVELVADVVRDEARRVRALDDVVALDEAKTVQGGVVTIHAGDNGVTVNDAKVVATDIETSNGVIHVIDTVLLPQ